MKFLQKLKETIFKVNIGTTKDPKLVLQPAMVKVNAPEENDLAEWFGMIEPEEGGDAILDPAFKNHRSQTVHLLASQLLQHQGSGAKKRKAQDYKKGKITLEALTNFVYEHDFSQPVGVREYAISAESMIQRFTKMSADEQAAFLLKLQKAGATPAPAVEESEEVEEETETE